jgi:alpha-1,3-rhamnosyl/mannosyltransferase
MKVVVDLRAVHPGLTGIGRYATNLCLSLEIGGGSLEVEAITTAAGAEYLKNLVSSPVHVVDPSARPEWDDLVLPDVLRNLRADVYHSPLFLLPPVRTCACVATVHDVIPVARPDLVPRSFREFFSRNISRALRCADHIVTVSKHSKDDLQKYFAVEPTHVTAIHEPVSPMFYRRPPDAVKSFLATVELVPGFILSVGAIDRRKNLSRLLAAYSQICRVLEDTPPLVLVGSPSGDGYDLRREVESLELTNQVRMLGRVTDEGLAHLYSGAKLLAFPSLYEGFGLPIVEAMATGTAVLASRTSSLPEIAQDAALFVDPESVDSISDALRSLLTNESLKSSLERKGLERAAHFSLKSQGEKLSALYRELRRQAA